VTDRVGEARGRVWTYAGTAAARERLAHGLRTGAAVVSHAYASGVDEGFRRLGPAQHAAFRASTDPLPPGCAPLALERVDLP